MKVSRVSPAAQNEENDIDHTYAQPFKNHGGQMNEMVSIEEVSNRLSRNLCNFFFHGYFRSI